MSRKSRSLPNGQSLEYFQRYEYQGKDDRKYVLVGGKLYEIEFEKDKQGKLLNTYLTTSVGDLLNGDKFLKDASPAKKLEMLGKIQKASTFMTWYESGDYAAWIRSKNGGDPEVHAEDVKQFGLDEDLQKVEGDLEKQAGKKNQPAPLPRTLQEIAAAKAFSQGVGLGMAFFVGALFSGKPPTVSGAKDHLQSQMAMRAGAAVMPKVMGSQHSRLAGGKPQGSPKTQ